jgi:hypothetical protein
MKVGDKVWLFDYNRRRYESGKGGGPIFAEHFYEAKIDGETSRSWMIGRQKFPKLNPRGIYNDEQKADMIWEHENRFKLRHKLDVCSINSLRKIDAIFRSEDEPTTQ